MAITTHTLTAGSAQAVVSEHGAQVLEWRTATRAHLFLSPAADLSGAGAIRGGVPVCFPWFGPRDGLPQHGFARTAQWHVVEAAEDRVRFGLRDDARSRELWDHGFRSELAVALAEHSLTLDFTVANTSPEPWDFTFAFHPYFRVADSRSTEVGGLPPAAADEVHGALRDGRVIDLRIPERSDATVLDDGSLLAIRPSEGFDATQVWNPGDDHALGDLPAQQWDRFVCVEPARVETPWRLAPGDAASLRMSLLAGSA